jgi:alanine racemase
MQHNVRLLQQLVGPRQLWPVIKGDAYGHGAVIVARHLIDLGYDTFGVADVEEAAALVDAGIRATLLILSPALPEHSEALVASGCEPVVCTVEMVDALARAAAAAGRRVAVHVKVDTGMGRVGIRPDQLPAFLDHCRAQPALQVRGLMSHLARADEADKRRAQEHIAQFRRVSEAARGYAIAVRHVANSPAILDLPDSYFGAVRPGIALYGLQPSAEIINPSVRALRPVLEWKTRVVFLKEVPAGGLSYGHAFHTQRPSLIATVPAGYADGLRRNLSNRVDLLVRGVRCPQVGRITMDMSLLDVTALRDQVGMTAQHPTRARGSPKGNSAAISGDRGTTRWSSSAILVHDLMRGLVGYGARRQLSALRRTAGSTNRALAWHTTT